MTPKAAAPVVVWMFGFVWMFWLRRLLFLFFFFAAVLLIGVAAMNERSFYYIGIAFFGMINGIFNPFCLVFGLI